MAGTKVRVKSRMKPPRQMSSMRCSSSACWSTRSNAARSLPYGSVIDHQVGTLALRASSSPAASDRLEMTSAISAG